MDFSATNRAARSTLVLLGFVSGMSAAPASGAAIDLFVSVAPLKFLAGRVGGERVRVQAMVQPGHSPVTYEPTPRQMVALASARAYLRVGVPFETQWLAAFRQANPAMDVIDVRDGIEQLSMGYRSLVLDHGNDPEHTHRDSDPHVWLDPLLAAAIAARVRDYLVRIDPGNGDEYGRNTELLLAELTRLDAEIRTITRLAENRKFLVFHPAWGYFARAYGLEQLAVEYQGKEPGPRSLGRLIDLARRENIRTVFVQKQFSSGVASTLAAEIGATVVALDPLDEDYFGNLRSAARAISGQADP